MDWNKTKTIFIIVFAILNIFLYSLYLNRHTEIQDFQVTSETTIEKSLKLDNIKYEELPVYDKESFYISAEVATFFDEELSEFDGQEFDTFDRTHLYSKLTTEVNLPTKKEAADFNKFLLEYVPNGESYVLWEVDEEEGRAVFFQKVNNHPIYFNENAMLIVNWDKNNEITDYDQRMFEEFTIFNKKNDLLAPIQVINTLYSRNYLKSDSTVLGMSLGYSTLNDVTRTGVFAPTWHVRVESKDGDIKEYFINAIEGKIIEFKNDSTDEDNE